MSLSVAYAAEAQGCHQMPWVDEFCEASGVGGWSVALNRMASARPFTRWAKSGTRIKHSRLILGGSGKAASKGLCCVSNGRLVTLDSHDSATAGGRSG